VVESRATAKPVLRLRRILTAKAGPVNALAFAHVQRACAPPGWTDPAWRVDLIDAYDWSQTC